MIEILKTDEKACHKKWMLYLTPEEPLFKTPNAGAHYYNNEGHLIGKHWLHSKSELYSLIPKWVKFIRKEKIK